MDDMLYSMASWWAFASSGVCRRLQFVFARL